MRKYAFLLSLFVLVLGASVAPAQPMSGTYTIKPSGGDFASHVEAANSLTARGISGPCTLEMYTGTYTGQAYLANIATTPTNHIIFKAAAGESPVVTNSSYAWYIWYTNDVTIDGITTISTGNHGVYAYYARRTKILDSKITASLDGICLTYSDTTKVAGCDIISGRFGIYLSFAPSYDSIIGNRIVSTDNGIYRPSTGNYMYYATIANNMVSSAVNPLHLRQHQYSQIHYNTFYSRGAYNAFYCNQGYYTSLRNNIYHNSGNGYVWVKWSGNNLSGFSDYNCFYSSTGYTYVIYNSSYGPRTLAQWQASGFDLNSINQDPLVASATNLHLRTGSPCIGAATPIPGITTDIDGDTRHATTPDIGADEWTNPGDPMSGVYTIIKDGTGDFLSFNGALDAVSLRGQSGDVTFCVYPGVYHERVVVVSPDNGSYKVVFQGLDTLGAPTGAVLNAGGLNHAVEFRNTKRFEFRHLGVSGFNIWGFALDYTGSFLGVDSCVIADCDISGPNGIYIHFNSHGNRIERNRVNATSGQGIRLWCTGTRNSHTYIANNMVVSAGNPLHLYNHQDSEIHYNTFYSRGAYNAFYDYQGYGGTYRNNIYHNSGDGYVWAKWYGDNLSGFSDYNCFYSSTGYTYVVYNSSYGGARTLAQWQASGFDLNSINQDPLVVADTNLHLQDGSPCIGAGTPITGITTDIDGDIRSATTPTIGADEVIGDASVTHVLAPGSMVPIGTPFTPQARVTLVSGPTSTFGVVMEIRKDGELVYTGTSAATTLAAGEVDTLDLSPPCTLTVPGTDYVATAWHLSTPDRNPGNDSASLDFAVIPPNADVGVAQIIQPGAFVDTNATFTPTARWRNYNTDDPVTFTAFFELESPTLGWFYAEEVTVADLGPGMDTVLTFTDVSVGMDTGNWTVRCSSYAAGDINPGNDAVTRGLVVAARPPWPEGWVEVAPIPAMAGNRRDMPHRGAWLAIGPDQGGAPAIYATKGNKLQNFYRYDVIPDSWTELEPAPLDPGRGRPLRQGARGISDGDNSIYMVHGNNTLAFWHYDIATNTWSALTDVPEGPSRKRVKGGGDMLYIEDGGTGYVYLLKGDRNEFWRYNTESGSWGQLATPPPGVRNRWKRDSWLAFDGAHIYAHKANYFTRGADVHDFYGYSVGGDSWYTQMLAGMPLNGLHGGRIKRKKAKDGGAGAYDGSVIYAIKGGNTQQFWMYEPAGDSWTESDTVPTFSPTTGKRRRVNAGADMVSYGPGVFFALKGNKTVEFWRYVVPMGTVAQRPERSGVMAGVVPAGAPFVKLGPNPLVGGYATLRYSLPKAGPAGINVYDVSGRNVLSRSLAASRSGAVSLDMRSLSAGVYLVKMEAGDFTATQKLVVQK